MGSLGLDSVLCHCHERLVTADYTLSLNGRRCAIARRQVQPGLQKSRAVVEVRLDGSCWVRGHGRHLSLEPLPLKAPVAVPATGLLEATAFPGLKLPVRSLFD